jgi:hypothetical protein
MINRDLDNKYVSVLFRMVPELIEGECVGCALVDDDAPDLECKACYKINNIDNNPHRGVFCKGNILILDDEDSLARYTKKRLTGNTYDG